MDSSCSNDPSMTLFWYISCFPLVLQQGATTMLDSLYWLERVLFRPQNDCQKKSSLQLKYLKSLYFCDLHIKEKCREMLQRDFSDYNQWLIIWVNLIISDNWSFNLSWFPMQYYYLHIASTNIPGHISRTSKNLIVICKTTTWQVSYKMREQKY